MQRRSSANRKRRLLAIAALLLLAWQVTSYLWLADDARGSVAAKYLPQDTHVRGPDFSWACISSATIVAMPPRQVDSMERALKRRAPTVYRGENTIPAGYRTPGGDCKDGFIIKLTPISSGPFWMRVNCSDYEASLCAYGRKATLIWCLGRWVHIWSTDEWIS